jgi:outer membrane protein
LQPGTEIAIVDSSELPLPSAATRSVAEAVAEGLMHQPQIIAALGKIDAAEGSLKAEQRSYYPTIELAGHGFQNIGEVSSDGKPYSTIDKPGGNILFSLSVPIFDGGTRRQRVSLARSKLREAEDKLDQARDSTAQQVVRAYNALITSLAENDAAVALSQAAHTAYDAASHAYQQGVGTYTDLTTEENAVVQADTRIEDARANAHTAAAALAFAIGTVDANSSE